VQGRPYFSCGHKRNYIYACTDSLRTSLDPHHSTSIHHLFDALWHFVHTVMAVAVIASVDGLPLPYFSKILYYIFSGAIVPGRLWVMTKITAELIR